MILLKKIKENLLYFVLFSMVAGISIGYFMDLSILKFGINYILFLMIYPMMINLNIIDVLKGFKDFKTIMISLALNFVISPLIAIIIGNIFFKGSPELFLGLLIIGLLPSSGMSASWTGLAKGNMKITLVLMSINLLASIIIMPFYLNIFADTSLSIDMFIITKSLLKVIIIPLILGDLTRRYLIYKKGNKGFKAMKPIFSRISSLGVVLIVFLAMSLKSKMILNHVSLVLYALIPINIYYLTQLLVADKIGNRLLDNKESISVVYTTVLRNLTIALGITMATFGDSLGVVIITIAYVIQIPLGTIYMMYLEKKKLKGRLV